MEKAIKRIEEIGLTIRTIKLSGMGENNKGLVIEQSIIDDYVDSGSEITIYVGE